MYMYTLGAGKILIKSIIIMCLLNLLARKASWVYRTGENEKKKNNDKIKQSVQTSSACGVTWLGMPTFFISWFTDPPTQIFAF